MVITIEELISKVEKLEAIAKTYASQKYANQYVCIYGRNQRKEYTTNEWKTVAGQLPSLYTKKFEASTSNLKEISQATLPNGETIDVPHFFATLNCCYKNHAELGGWGGDLTTYAADIKNGKIAKLDSGLYNFPDGTFDKEDYITDIDADIIYRNSTMKDAKGNKLTSLAERMRYYYITKEMYKKREKYFNARKTIEKSYNTAVSKDIYLKYLKNNTYKVSDTYTSTASKAVQAYITDKIKSYK